MSSRTNANSITDAIKIGKRLAAERAQSYGGKYWYMGIEKAETVKKLTLKLRESVCR